MAVVPTVLAVLAGAGLLASRLARRGKRGGEPPKPPWETAFQRLRTLQAAGLSDAGRFEAYYVDLSAILRYYIEDRFALPARSRPLRSSWGAPPGMANSRPTNWRFVGVPGVLRRVKFANHVPTRHGAKEHFDAVEGFVTATIPHGGRMRHERAPHHLRFDTMTYPRAPSGCWCPSRCCCWSSWPPGPAAR